MPCVDHRLVREVGLLLRESVMHQSLTKGPHKIFQYLTGIAH